MGKTLQELKELNAGTVVHNVSIEENDYPYYFIGEESVGWGEYTDFSNFNPFEILGFDILYHHVEVDEDELSGEVYDTVEKIEDIMREWKSLSEVKTALKNLEPGVKVTTKRQDPDTGALIETTPWDS